MSDPVLHLIAGPNGAGKTTLYELVIGPATHLEFVNADVIAAELWPDDQAENAYEAAARAAQRRLELMERRESFVTETVFSHESKLELVQAASDSGYLITLHVVMVPKDLAVARVRSRVEVGGHSVPDEKVRERYTRLWSLIASAIEIVDVSIVYDNCSADRPFDVIAKYERGRIVGARTPGWPAWTPEELRAAGE